MVKASLTPPPPPFQDIGGKLSMDNSGEYFVVPCFGFDNHLIASPLLASLFRLVITDGASSLVHLLYAAAIHASHFGLLLLFESLAVFF